ncbi:MAG: CPBP family intramembrane metalloprotease [Gammaproteobacteria bacterium]|nr:CPBP family intramembrane metalloprotease [Gammaproteobacteria bacterium]
MAHPKTSHLVVTLTAHPATFLVAGGIAVGVGALQDTPSDPALTTLFLWLAMAPFAEELVFRGALLEWLSRRISDLAANVICSALFVIAHYVFVPSLWSLLTFIPSIWFGLLYLRHRDLVLPTCAHALCNVAFIVGHVYFHN